MSDTEKKPAGADSFKCPSCGADMRSDDKNGKLFCDYCNRAEEICTAEETTEEHDFLSAETNKTLKDWEIETKVIKCTDCGGKAIITASETEVACPFCGSPAQVTDEPPGIRPDSLVPFKIERNKAFDLFVKWIKKRRMAPFKLKKEYLTDNLKGVYIPYWSYGSSTNSAYTGQAGDYYKETEMRTVTVEGKTEMKPHRTQKIKWRFVSGTYDRNFKDIIFSDSGLDKKTLENLEPFMLNELLKYNPKYLSGFFVEHYRTGLKTVWERAKAFMSRNVRNDIKEIIKRSCDVVGKLSICTNYTNISYQHMLLPVWVSSYRFRNKVYNFSINGQTGEIQGRSPKSALKIGIIVFIGLAVLAALYFFVIR